MLLFPQAAITHQHLMLSLWQAPRNQKQPLKADEIRYISDEYTADCMMLRNYAMVDNSVYCICASLRGASGTAQTIAYAKEKGVTVINVAK